MNFIDKFQNKFQILLYATRLIQSKANTTQGEKLTYKRLFR